MPLFGAAMANCHRSLIPRQSLGDPARCSLCSPVHVGERDHYISGLRKNPKISIHARRAAAVAETAHTTDGVVLEAVSVVRVTCLRLRGSEHLRVVLVEQLVGGQRTRKAKQILDG